MKIRSENEKFIARAIAYGMVRFTAMDYTCVLTLVDVNAQPDDRICWFLKKIRAEEGCHGPLRQFDEAIARYVNGN